MTSLYQVFVCSVLFVIVNGAPKCNSNEYLDSCASDCAYDYCPNSELHDQTPCPKAKECEPACKCIFNYRRENGTCIPSRNCPAFPCDRPNEYFDPCPAICPAQDCSAATPTGECPFLILTVIPCSPSCRCVPGYWRKNGVCVPYDECSK